MSFLGKKVPAFKRELVKTSNVYCDPDLYTLNFHLLDYMVEVIWLFGAMNVLDNSASEHFNVHIKQAYKEASPQRRTRMSETANMMEWTYGEMSV